MISRQRAKEINESISIRGVKETAKLYNVSPESVRRYRKYLRKEEREYDEAKTPNILILDIETAPLTALIWSRYQKYIDPSAIIDDWFIISYAAKWLFDPEIISGCVTPEEAVTKDDKRIVGELWKLLEDADIIIAHNGDKFDIKRIKTRFMYYDMGFTTPFQTIDTLKTLRREGSNTSNRLNDICKDYGLPCKIDNGGIDRWYGCKQGDQAALDEMLEYNINDVYILEELYVRIRKYIRNHPNIGLYIDTDKPVCHNCGSANLNWIGYYYTGVNKYSSFRCSCGAIGRCRVTAISKKQSANINIHLAR